MDRQDLIADIKKNLASSLNIQPEDLDFADENTPLFEEDGLGLDSVDALELIVMLENKYKILVDDKDEAKKIFATMGALADYILAKQ